MKNLKYLIIFLTITIFTSGCSNDDDTEPTILNNQKQITSFQFLASENSVLTNNIVTTINQSNNTISASIDGAINITALLPKIEVSPKASISPSGSLDFTNPVTYTVTAEDGTKATYSITLSLIKSDEKQIVSFNFLALENVALSKDIVTEIDEASMAISTIVPIGTNVSALSPSIEISENATIDPTGPQDFSSPVTYTVTAQNSSTISYTVEVKISKYGIISHLATSENTSGHITTIDSDLTNGKSGAILIVTQKFGVYNDNEIGVWYSNSKWHIFNQNLNEIPANAQFNVLVLPADSENAFIHTTNSSNISGHITYIDSEFTNNKPGALIYITQNFGKYNTSSVGVWYSSNSWSIYNEDISQAMPEETKFNILVLDPGDTKLDDLNLHAFTHNNSSTSHISHIPSPPIDLSNNSILFSAQNYNGVYNPNATGVWFSESLENWTIFNQNRTTLPIGVRFNVLAASIE
ncbi:MAG: hypothetical protein V3U92_09275 [Cellulophaga sp.]